jgi:1-acyl-sn-glycerol-3-phosphate acyltransferase
MHGPLAWAMAGSIAWMLWAATVAWARRPAFRGGDLAASAARRLIGFYARALHALSVEGLEHVPRRTPEGLGARPLVIVANHTAGIDPLLIQAALPFEPRWVMARDMRVESLDWAWDFGRVIFVDRETGESAGLREALRHLKSRGTLGMFPEGAIERPPGRLLPFQPGVGLLIARTRALVLPVVVSGTPHAPTAWGSLTRFSRSRVRFLPLIDFEAQGTPPSAIAGALQRRFEEATGWPVNPLPPKFENGRWWYVDDRGEYRPEE